MLNVNKILQKQTSSIYPLMAPQNSQVALAAVPIEAGQSKLFFWKSIYLKRPTLPIVSLCLQWEKFTDMNIWKKNAKFSFELVKSTEVALRFLCTKKQ